MTILYASSSSNKLQVIEVHDTTGNLVRILQTIEPIVNPLPSSTFDNKPMPTKGIFQPVTEWIITHPKYDLLYALTSFWSQAYAIVVTFQIDNDGTLRKLGQTETGGLQAAYATIFESNSIITNINDDEDGIHHGQYTLCIGHHNDGTVSFFDCSQDNVTLSSHPFMRIMIPEIKPETRTTTFPFCLPSVHHISYTSDKKYLLVSDSSSQGRVWTYEVDEYGIPTNDDPVHSHKVTYVSSVPGWIALLMTKPISNFRIRRCIVHPTNQRFAYLLMEFNAVIQVYEYDSITGKIYGDCLQEIPTIDPSYKNGTKWIGVGINGASEMHVTETEILVSNRGIQKSAWLGLTECSIRIFEMQDDGAKLNLKQVIETSGPVRHFYMNGDSTTLHVGINNGVVGQTTKSEGIETYRRPNKDDIFEKVGHAHIDMDILCIARKS